MKKATWIFIMAITCICIQSCDVNTYRHTWWYEEVYNSKINLKAGERVKLAIIDSGVYEEHPDLKKANITELKTSNIKETKNNSNSHGTSIAGLIVATPSNKNGLFGIAPSTEIISIKYCNDSETTDIKYLIEAFEIAYRNSVDIICVSSGTSINDNDLEHIVKKCVDKGIIIIASAGNVTSGDLLYPSKYDGVIAVSARDKNFEQIFEYKNQKVVYAAGVDVMCLNGLSTNIDALYIDRDGSSISTGVVAGLVSALISEQKIKLNVAQWESLFKGFKNKNMGIENLIKEAIKINEKE